MPKGRLFPDSRDDLIECAALLDCVRRGELDALQCRARRSTCSRSRSWRRCRAANGARTRCSSASAARIPTRRSSARNSMRSLRMLAEGFTSRHGPRGAYVHRDAVSRHAAWPAWRQADRRDLGRRDSRQRRFRGGAGAAGLADRHGQRGLRGRKSGGRRLPARQYVVPDSADRRRARARRGRERPAAEHPVLARRGAGAQRRAVVRRRADACADRRLARRRRPTAPLDAAIRSLADRRSASIEEAARQIVEYLARARAALSVLPTQDTLVMERFFDESGGTQLVIHAPFGSRVNRAWGLALRKRFCRTFNFELQAAATEDAIVLSLTRSPQLRARRSLALPALEHRRARADPGAARRAAVRRALALERDQCARAAALHGRAQGRAAVAAHEKRGPARDDVSRSGRVRRKRRRRA